MLVFITARLIKNFLHVELEKIVSNQLELYLVHVAFIVLTREREFEVYYEP